MFVEESIWIKTVLVSLDLPRKSQVLNVGSNTLHYRQVAQSYIDHNVFRPLRERGCEVFHLDVLDEAGVDIICDITNLAIEPIDYIGRTFDLIICTNMLTEVEDLLTASRRLKSLVRDSGHILVTVPCRYRKYGPGDRMYRSSVQDIQKLFLSSDAHRLSVVAGGVLRVNDRGKYRTIYGTLNPLRRYSELFRYWVRPFRWKVSCVLFRLD